MKTSQKKKSPPPYEIAGCGLPFSACDCFKTVRELREVINSPDLHENDLTNVSCVSVGGTGITRVFLS